MLTVKEHNRRMVQQPTAKGTTSRRVRVLLVWISEFKMSDKSGVYSGVLLFVLL